MLEVCRWWLFGDNGKLTHWSMQVCNSLWIIAKIKTREMPVWATFAKISSRENFYLYSTFHLSAHCSSFFLKFKPFQWPRTFFTLISRIMTLLRAINIDHPLHTQVNNLLGDFGLLGNWAYSYLIKIELLWSCLPQAKKPIFHCLVLWSLATLLKIRMHKRGLK